MAQLKIQVTPINWHGIKQDAINLSLFFFVTKRILFRESFYLSPLMVKLKIRVTPNDHRFALLCHCRAVGTMNREGRGVIAPSPLTYFDRYVNPISIKIQGGSLCPPHNFVISAPPPPDFQTLLRPCKLTHCTGHR